MKWKCTGYIYLHMKYRDINKKPGHANWLIVGLFSCCLHSQFGCHHHVTHVIVGEAKKDIRISRKPCAGQRAFGISPLRHGGLDPHIGNRKYRDNAMDESCIPHKTTVTSALPQEKGLSFNRFFARLSLLVSERLQSCRFWNFSLGG